MISNQSEYESTLSEQSLRLDALFDAFYADVMIMDGEGVVKYVSEYSAKLYGLSRDFFLGRNVYELEGMGVFAPSATKSVLATRKRVSIAQNLKNGQKVLVTAVPIFDDENEIIRVVSYTHNLTDLMRFKENLLDLQRDMDRVHGELELLRERQMSGLITAVNSMNSVVLSNTMKTFLDVLQRVAQSEATVLLLGESGVGKSLYARHTHRISERRDGPFIELNCATIPEQLFESELFGYQAGAFTGASKSGRMGMFELANCGTIFLDEIGEIPISLQAKLLKVIHEKSFHRVGGTNEIKSNFRIVAATNRDLKRLVEDGKFREDLYFRLNVVPLRVPSLRERQEDIRGLTDEFLAKFNARYMRSVLFAGEVYQRLAVYSWPGNIRELEHLVERLVVMSAASLIEESALPSEFRTLCGTETSKVSRRQKTLRDLLAEYEKELLMEARFSGLTTTQIAKRFGMSQATVVRKLQRYKIGKE